MAKTIEEIKEAQAKNHGWPSYDVLCRHFIQGVISYSSFNDFLDDVIKDYANSKLEAAAECATTKEIQTGNMHTFGGSIPQYIRVVDKQSILNLREEV